MTTQEKIEKIMLECYIELYKNSTPSADFNQLVKDATINELGQKEIPFDDYYISEDLFQEIMDKVLKKYKINKYYKESIRRSIALGCSPSFTKE